MARRLRMCRRDGRRSGHDVVCGPQAAGQRRTRAHHRVSALPPAGGPGLADSATKVAQLGAGASHRVSVVPSPRGPGVEAARGGRRAAADRTGVHLLRAPVRVHAAAGHPGQPLRAVRSPGAAAQAPRRARGDAVDPGFPGRARAERRRPRAHAVGPGARRGAAAQRQAPARGQDAEQRADLGADRGLLARRAGSSSCCAIRPRRWPRCTPRSTRRGAPRKPATWTSPWPAGCGT